MSKAIRRAAAWVAVLVGLAFVSVRVGLEGAPFALLPLAAFLWPAAATLGHRLGRTAGSAAAAFLLAFSPPALSALAMWVERGLPAAGLAAGVGASLGVVGAAGALTNDHARGGAVMVGCAGFAATVGAVLAGYP